MLQNTLQYMALGTAIFLFYYIGIVIFSSYTLTEDEIIYETLFSKVKFQWKDISGIENREPALIEKHSIVIFSIDGNKEIPITSWVCNYKTMLRQIMDRIENNEGVMIDSNVISLISVR